MDNQEEKRARAEAELDRRIAGLARDVAPDRDLWPDIEARLDEQEHAAPSRYGWWGAAAAALAVAALLPLLLREAPDAVVPVSDDVPMATVPETTAPRAIVPEATIPVETSPGMPASGIDTSAQRLRLRNAAVTSVRPGPEYDEARAELLELLEERLEGLAPEEREIVVRNIEAIRGALEEIDTALQDNPDDPLLQELMLKTYQTELDVMARVNGLAGPARRRTDL
ncbi:MAG: hypothetical protein P8172_11620 [Gammaproteobacteria bacterium]